MGVETWVFVRMCSVHDHQTTHQMYRRMLNVISTGPIVLITMFTLFAMWITWVGWCFSQVFRDEQWLTQTIHVLHEKSLSFKVHRQYLMWKSNALLVSLLRLSVRNTFADAGALAHTWTNRRSILWISSIETEYSYLSGDKMKCACICYIHKRIFLYGIQGEWIQKDINWTG